jgi:hypothetical protein
MRSAGGCWFQQNELEFSATRMSALCQKQTYGIAANSAKIPPLAGANKQRGVSRRTLRLFRCGHSINFLLEFL